MSLADFRRTLRTVRHLRWSQIAWGLRYRWRRRRPPVLPVVPSSLRVRDDRPRVPVLPSRHDEDDARFVSDMARGVFSHLGERVELGRENPDWRLGDRARDRLWTVTLHYHHWALRLATIAAGSDELADRAAELLHDYLADWIERCPLTEPGSRALVWNSYAIATRIVVWGQLDHALTQRRRADWGDLRVAMHRILWQQAAFLRANLEYDLRGNHLLRDAVGLAAAGSFFDGEEAREWYQAGIDLGLAQVREQVLLDGGHFERSPMYHLHAMEDVLALACLSGEGAAREEFAQTWRRMADVAEWLRHPDGDIPLFNDAAVNGSCHPQDMLDQGATSLGFAPASEWPRGSRHFPDFGMVVGDGDRFRVFFDVGAVGPDYQPGHAHADTLSLECSFDGRRVFVDPGTFHYDEGPTRAYDRSTAAHNTVCVDAHDSSEAWHIFRLGRRARPSAVAFESTNGLRSSARHDGYAWLPGAPIHVREVVLQESGPLIVTDHIEGGSEHDLSGGFLLAPEWRVQEQRTGGWAIRCERAVLEIEVVGPDGLRLGVESRDYHPGFGQRFECERLTWRFRGALPVEIRTTIRG